MIAHGTPEAVQRNEKVIAAYLGEVDHGGGSGGRSKQPARRRRAARPVGAGQGVG